MAYRFIRKTVNEFQEPNTALAKNHYHDLKYSAFVLYNTITNKLKKGTIHNDFFVDTVIGASKVIEETTLMRQQIKVDERMYKEDIIDFYFNEEQEYRKPNAAKDLKAFQIKKPNKVKDCAIEIVAKMYRLDCINRKEMAEEIAEAISHFED